MDIKAILTTAGSVVLSWLSGSVSYITGTLIPNIIFFVIGILLVQIVLTIIGKMLQKTKLEKAAHTLIRSTARVFLYLTLGLVIATRLGIDVTAIVALASVLTLAISLAVQNALSNVIGGFTLLSTRPFSSGDFVEIAGQSGSVQEIGLTYTKLSTPDNKIVSIPNSSVVAAQIVNYTTSGTRRVTVRINASYDSGIEQVLTALRQSADVPTALQDPAPFAALENYGESTITYVMHLWCKSEDFWTTTFAVNQNIKAKFEENQVSFSYPHLNVHVEK